MPLLAVAGITAGVATGTVAETTRKKEIQPKPAQEAIFSKQVELSQHFWTIYPQDTCIKTNESN